MSHTMPLLGAGTFRLKQDDAYQSVLTALKQGYRHIDTAQIYGNEAEVGRAIQDSGLPRDDVFITTKVWLDKLDNAHFLASVEESLSKLKTDYVDLLLIHWPLMDGTVPMESYLTQLYVAQQRGLTRHIGVSNFTCQQLDDAIEILGPGRLYTNQIEVHPFLQNRTVVEHCEANDILVTAYMPLAVGRVLEEPAIVAVAEQAGCTPAQATLAWIRQLGMATIPSSTNPAHLQANLDSQQVVLSAEQMAAFEGLDRGLRLADPDFGPDWD
ncbi:2,5-didehydrogluconate reductase DkgB [Ferrimonas balearica]|uniref:2,5-didehydrogluconate reductase DkgB n=1 Tax=Ferrimonas balearica TaxID=44012 RepID=UPI001C952F36|nr:2,5-didehydrogluconate reductase DkgB [Ferrimonas balearica]MBY6105973.1 2,5-didehydrogluconate reductase DkgB [Ferrimonas balearica]